MSGIRIKKIQNPLEKQLQQYSQEELNQKIAKEEQKNLYLTEVLQSFNQQYEHAKANQKNKILVQENKSVSQRMIATQMHTIDTKIQICQKQLNKIKEVSTESLFQATQCAKEQLKNNIALKNQLKKEIQGLERETERMYIKDHSLERNNQMQSEFQSKSIHLKILTHKLERIKDSITQNPSPSLKKKPRSLSKRVNKSTINVGEAKESKNIDKYAFYKNLLKFYLVQEQKIKQEINLLKNI